MLTRSGLGAILTAGVLAMLGLWWHYEELIIVAVATAAIVAMSILIARRPLRAQVVRRLTTIRVPRGDSVRLTYRVRNDSGHRSGRATLIDSCDGTTIETTIEPVGDGDITDVPAAIATHRRGVFEVGPLDIQKVDPFFLAVGRRRHESNRPNLVTVHPKIYELTGPQGASRAVEHESIVRRAATDPMSGFVSMREYVAGDDPRLIHWPTTARTGTLMIREHVEVRRPEFTVVVDTGAEVGTPEDFEEAVDVAATLAVHALRTGLDVVVRTTDREHAGVPAPLQTEGEVLDLLTAVRQSTEAAPIDIAALFAHGFDHTSVLVITGPSGPTTHIGANDQMITVRIGDGATAGGGIALAAVDAPDFANRWRSWS